MYDEKLFAQRIEQLRQAQHLLAVIKDINRSS